MYTIYEGHEIMFHVSTLLPYVKDSKQQVFIIYYQFKCNQANFIWKLNKKKLERKRHIGNDIVTIVFQDLDENEDEDKEVEADFNPSSARSQFQHIFALVVYNKRDHTYKLKIYSEQTVPPFGPCLPSPPVFGNHKEFREFLLVKCNYFVLIRFYLRFNI